MLLVRKVLQHLFACLKRHKWCVALTIAFGLRFCTLLHRAHAAAAGTRPRWPPSPLSSRSASSWCVSAPLDSPLDSGSKAFLNSQATEREFALGLSLHVIDVYLACLAPTAPPSAALAALLRPFVTLLAQEGHPVLVDRARATVLLPLAQGEAELQLAPSELTVRTTNQKISHAMQHV
jgi:hypothetical protein